jgi:hypothetical protein
MKHVHVVLLTLTHTYTTLIDVGAAVLVCVGVGWLVVGIKILETLPSYNVKRATGDGSSIVRVLRVIWPGDTQDQHAYTCGGCGRQYW